MIKTTFKDFNSPQAVNGYPINDLLLDKIFSLVDEDMDNHLSLHGECKIFNVKLHKGHSRQQVQLEQADLFRTCRYKEYNLGQSHYILCLKE